MKHSRYSSAIWFLGLSCLIRLGCMATQHVCSIFRQAGEPVTSVVAFELVFSQGVLVEIRIIMNSVVRTYHMHHGHRHDSASHHLRPNCHKVHQVIKSCRGKGICSNLPSINICLVVLVRFVVRCQTKKMAIQTNLNNLPLACGMLFKCSGIRKQ